MWNDSGILIQLLGPWLACAREGVSIHVGYIPSFKHAGIRLGGAAFYDIQRLAALIVCIYNLDGLASFVTCLSITDEIASTTEFLIFIILNKSPHTEQVIYD